MAILVSAFRTALMQEFGLSEDNDNEGTSSDAVLQYMNEANAFFINHRAWTFRMKPKTQYIYPNSTVTTAFTTAATSMVLGSTANWGSTGRVMCDYDIIEFTANNGTTTLTITTADIDRNHEASERVFLMYEVPSDYNKIAQMMVKDTPYFKEDQRVGKEPSVGRFWEVEVKLPLGAIKKYFVFPWSTTTQKIYFMYAQKATTLAENSYMEVPEPYWDYIKRSVSARIYRHLEELSLATEHENKAMEILRKAAIYDSKQHYGNKIPLRSEWDDPVKLLNIGGARKFSGHST